MHVGGYFTFTLYCLDADGSHLRRLIEQRGKIDFSWSPDSRQLAFTCSEEVHRSGNRPGELSILDLERSEVHQIIKEPAYPIWSPVTAQIAFLVQQTFLEKDEQFESFIIASPAWQP
jgi:Tol biopolymer transport system component